MHVNDLTLCQTGAKPFNIWSPEANTTNTINPWAGLGCANGYLSQCRTENREQKIDSLCLAAMDRTDLCPGFLWGDAVNFAELL